MAVMAPAHFRPRFRLDVLVEGRGTRAWYRADVTTRGVRESVITSSGGAPDPLTLAVLDAAIDGARETARAIGSVVQLHLPGIEE